MRITIIGPAYPYRGGIADTNESLAVALQERGDTVSIATFTAQYPKFLFPGKTQYVDGPAPAGLTIRPCVHSYNPLTWRRTAQEIVDSGAELVIFRFWTPFIAICYSALARRLRAKVKLIALVDNASPHESSAMDAWLSKRFLNKVQAAMCLSSYVEGELKSLVNLPTASYRHPINTDLEPKIDRALALDRLRLDKSKRYLLFFGLIRQYKGLDLLLQSMALLKARIPEIRLIIAGEFYEDKEGYLTLIRELGLTDFVHVYEGFVAKEDVATYFSAAEMLTLTYLSATQSGVTQMAMYYDLPMLVTDVGALREYVQHDEMGYVLPKEPEIIAEKITDFITKNRHAEMSEVVRAGKEKYSWRRFSMALMDLVHRV